MKKYLFVLVFTGFCIANYCNAQVIVVKPPPKKKSAVKSLPKANNPSHSVSITTNEDCILKINDKEYGSLKSGQTKIQYLSDNTYKIEAENSKTGDRYKVDLIVNGSPEEVKIDLRTPIIERQRRDSLEKLKRANDSIMANENADAAEKKKRDSVAKIRLKNDIKNIVSVMAANMLNIPPGSFNMGNNLGANDEGPVHSVTVGEIAFSKYEVTQRQWTMIMGTNPSVNHGCDSCPVENVSFYEIDSFLTKINQLGSKKSSGCPPKLNGNT